MNSLAGGETQHANINGREGIVKVVDFGICLYTFPFLREEEEPGTTNEATKEN